MVQGWICEVFNSIQGEGIYIGSRQTFIRFAGCNLRCQYCDTRRAQKKKLYFNFGKQKFSNPVSVEQLINLVQEKEVSLTGGEPLVQADFLYELLRSLKRHGIGTYLETNGTIVEPLRKLLPYIDFVSLDFKIPSATGERPYWKEHEAFLRLCRNQHCFVKIVVNKNLREAELLRVVEIIKRVDKNIPLVIQPIGLHDLKPLMLFQKIGLEHLPDVRIIPQLHKILRIR